MGSWRVTVKSEETEKLEAFKDAHYKQLYDSGATKMVFEVPSEEDADALVADAKKSDLEASKEEFADPIDEAEPVDFW